MSTTDAHILVRVTHLTVGSLHQTILQDLSFDIQKGEVLGLSGNSGSGKSMTALALLSYLPPQIIHKSGAIEWPSAGRANAIFQDALDALNPIMTARAQLAETVKAAQPNQDKDDINSRVNDWAKLVKIDAELLEKYPHQLSGGQQQRLIIALALATEAELIIADEPTTALDARLQTEILNLITQLCTQKGRSLLLISHDAEVLQTYCTRILSIEKGQIVEPIAPKSQIGAGVLNEHLPKAPKFHQPDLEATPLLEVKNLSISYTRSSFFGLRQIPTLTVLKDCSFSLGKGEGLVIMGASGVGKSSLARSLTLPNALVSGQVRFQGQAVTIALGQPVHPRIQMIWQDASASLNPRLTIGTQLHEIAALHTTQADLTILLNQLGLDISLLERYPGQISGGQKQRIAIVRALLAKPQLLICDEITASVDAATASTILLIIKDLVKSGVSVIFITHQLKIAEALGFTRLQLE